MKTFLEDLRKLVVDTDDGKRRHYQATLAYLRQNLDALDWLIEQAEKVEQLEERIMEGVKSHWGCAPCLAYDKLQAKAERYEKALREIANEQEVGEGDFNAADVANNLIATAKEALEGEK